MKKLSNMTFCVLNLANRAILKVVLQAIPVYQLLVLPVPKYIYQDLVSIFCNFLWQGANLDRKWSLVAWDKLCLSKAYGGLELIDSEKLNESMRAKL